MISISLLFLQIDVLGVLGDHLDTIRTVCTFKRKFRLRRKYIVKEETTSRE